MKSHQRATVGERKPRGKPCRNIPRPYLLGWAYVTQFHMSTSAVARNTVLQRILDVYFRRNYTISRTDCTRNEAQNWKRGETEERRPLYVSRGASELFKGAELMHHRQRD